MATKGKTKKGKLEPWQKTDAEKLALMAKEAELYPPRVVEGLRDGLLDHVKQTLKDTGFEAEAHMLGSELFELDWRLRVYKYGKPKDMLKLYEFWGGDHLKETAALVLRLMAKNGELDYWGQV